VFHQYVIGSIFQTQKSVSDTQKKWLKDVISDFVPLTSYRDHQEIRQKSQHETQKQLSTEVPNPDKTSAHPNSVLDMFCILGFGACFHGKRQW